MSNSIARNERPKYATRAYADVRANVRRMLTRVACKPRATAGLIALGTTVILFFILYLVDMSPQDVSWHVAPVVGALAASAGHAISLRPRTMRIVRPGATGEAGQAGQAGALQGYPENLLVEGAIPATLSGVEAPGAVWQTDR